MTNIRLRIEDAVPGMGLGSVGHSLFAGTTSLDHKGSSNTQVAYRMARVTAARVETI